MAGRWRFFLGGDDLEMREIRALLDGGGQEVVDHALSWGARASSYRDEIAQARRDGRIPVLVELEIDLDVAEAIVIDHHGSRAGAPPALRQVFDLLGLPDVMWTPRRALVAANDVGHVAAMRALGANDAQMRSIRAEERRIRGISSAEEDAGRAALASAQRWAHDLIVARLDHDKCAAVTDPLAFSPDAACDLLVLTPSGPNFFGSGARVARLDQAFAGGWSGGDLPRRGYWGHGRGISEAPLRAVLCDAAQSKAREA